MSVGLDQLDCTAALPKLPVTMQATPAGYRRVKYGQAASTVYVCPLSVCSWEQDGLGWEQDGPCRLHLPACGCMHCWEDND